MEALQTSYIHIWHKYRPVILRLMVNARETAQQYVFSSHEFKRVAPTYRGGLAFLLYFHRSKALNNIKTSTLAKELLEILQQSQTASKLAENSTFEFMLDKHFVFHVRKNDPADKS
jgi:hypothetical protein